MSLRSWLICIAAIAGALSVLTVVGVSALIVVPAFARTEEVLARGDLARCTTALDQQVLSVARTCSDYARRDDTAEFADTGHPPYVERNLIPATFLDNGIELIVVRNRSGDLVWGGECRRSDSAVSPASGIPGATPADEAMLARPDAAGLQGIILTTEGPLLLAVRPVTGSSGREPSHGTLLVGRWLGKDTLAEVQGQVRVLFAADPIQGLPTPGEPTVVVDSRSLRASTTYPGLKGSPGLLISFERPREITQRGIRASRLGTMAQGTLIVLVVVFAYVVLKRGVVVPLEKLGVEVRAAPSGAGLASRVCEAGAIEVRGVAAGINHMLEALEHADHALRESESRLRATVSNAAVGVLRLATDGTVLESNQRWAEMVGYGDPREVAGLDFVRCAQADYRDELHAHIAELGMGLIEQFRVEVRCIRQDESAVWVDLAGGAVRGEDDRVESIVLVAADIDDRKRAEHELRNLARRDPLTGLANRTAFEERLELECQRAVRTATALSLLMIDVDWFKEYNDAEGHLAGDECLKLVSAMLRSSCRSGLDLPSRWGGEEFAVVLADTDRSQALACAERIRVAVEDAGVLRAGRMPGRVTVSIGAATAPPATAVRAPDLVDAADRAMYRSKGEGRNRVTSVLVRRG